MRYTIIIPARLKSTRLPNKMLRLLAGKPIIEWTWQSAQRSKADNIIIATDDDSIYNHMKAAGATVIMTKQSHETGTDRLSEVALTSNFSDDQIIVNWQGDEPFLPANLVDQVAHSLQVNLHALMSTLATRITTWEEFNNPNAVKVICNSKQEAIYFSRSPIPYPREGMQKNGSISDQYTFLRHIGVYGYRASFLKHYPNLAPSPLEELEKLEQLRALDNGATINVSLIDNPPPNGIDTETDLLAAGDWLKINYKG